MKILYLIVSITLFAKSYGQQKSIITEVWAYKIQTIGGAPIDPEIAPQRENAHLEIYISSKTPITRVEVWEKEGNHYKASIQKIENLPVALIPNKILVPAGKANVWELRLEDKSAAKPGAPILSALKKNECVISYIYKNIKYIHCIKQLKTEIQEAI